MAKLDVPDVLEVPVEEPLVDDPEVVLVVEGNKVVPKGNSVGVVELLTGVVAMLFYVSAVLGKTKARTMPSSSGLRNLL
jgi:hypothetical protein